MNFFVRLILSSVAVLVVAYLLPGVEVNSFFTAFVLAIVLSFLNYTVKPILIVLTIPITVVTLGLFLLVINALVVLLADSLISGFYVDGFWWALVFSLLLSLTNSLLTDLSGKDQK
ncbi:MAG: phage holin family protein [Cyclobacteriaceae bacterium]|nr:phage holin family protein [Cyclobacteriaceae bacterium HetDA_MAG_MS6]